MANTIPNLDGMSEGELRQFWFRYHRPTWQDAETLIGDRRPGFTRLASVLATYAINKSVAMTCRRHGDIKAALVYEGAAELYYSRFPDDLRW